jgi:hypothetical protein
VREICMLRSTSEDNLSIPRLCPWRARRRLGRLGPRKKTMPLPCLRCHYLSLISLGIWD